MDSVFGPGFDSLLLHKLPKTYSFSIDYVFGFTFRVSVVVINLIFLDFKVGERNKILRI